MAMFDPLFWRSISTHKINPGRKGVVNCQINPLQVKTMKTVINIFLLLLIPSYTLAANNTTIGALTVTPTFENAGFIIFFADDDNANMTAAVELCDFEGGNCFVVYSSSTAIPVYIDRRTKVNDGGSTVSNIYEKTIRGSFFELTRNTTYTCKITFTDTDGVTGINPVVSRFTTWRHDQENNSGMTYNVSNDENFSSAMSSAAAGDIISIGAGTYTISSFTAKGSSGNPVKYVAADPSSKPVFSSYVSVEDRQWIESMNFTNGVKLNGDRYVVFKSCDFDNNGIVLGDGDNSGLLVESCYINLGSEDATPAKDTGIYATLYHSGSGVARYNTAYGGRDALCGGEQNRQSGAGFSNWDFYGNDVLEFTDDGLEIEGGIINVRVYYNTVREYKWGGSVSGAGNPFGIAPIIWGPIYFFNNQAWDGVAGFKTGQPGGGDINPDGQVYVLYNTFYNIKWGVFRANSPAQSNIDGVGNAWSCNSLNIHEQGSITPGFDWDYNYWDSSTGASWNFAGHKWMAWTDWRTEGQDENGDSISDLGLADPSNGDLSIAAGSSLIGAGVSLSHLFTKDIDGEPRGEIWDVGADQY